MRLVLPLLLAAGLGAWGILVDRARPVPQPWLWGALQLASLGGALAGALWVRRRFAGGLATLGLAVAVLLAWRVAYFPIMVFSGHVASIGEWLALSAGLPVLVYPVFLLSVIALHAVAALGVSWLLRPPRAWLRLVLVPAFAVAGVVSFSNAEDLALLPDRVWALEAPVPPPRRARANPYLPALGGDAYRAHQNLMLLAAGLTYETIPDSPWGRTVKAVLEQAFQANPVASTGDRVREHYLAYHSAHPLIGCATPVACAVEEAPPVAAGPP